MTALFWKMKMHRLEALYANAKRHAMFRNPKNMIELRNIVMARRNAK